MLRSIAGALLALTLASCKPNAPPGTCGTAEPSADPVCAPSSASASASTKTGASSAPR